MSIIIRKHNFYDRLGFFTSHYPYYDTPIPSLVINNEFDAIPNVDPVVRMGVSLSPSGDSLSVCYTGTISSSGTYDSPPNTSNGNIASNDAKHYIRYNNRRVLEWIPVIDISCDKPPQSGAVLADFYIQPSWNGGVEQASASGSEYVYTQYIGSVFSNTFAVQNDDFRNDYRLNFHNNILPKFKNINNFAIRVFNRSTTAISVNIKLLPSFVEISDE